MSTNRTGEPVSEQPIYVLNLTYVWRERWMYIYIFFFFEGKKSLSCHVITSNDKMKDNRVVASDVLPRYLFSSES